MNSGYRICSKKAGMKERLVKVCEAESIRLTHLSSKGGCASKFGPGNLEQVLRRLKTGDEAGRDPNLLVGFNTCDDAGVYKIASDYALIQTVDFFTPIVDDPYTFGSIAAANALSDVYAMGGKPLTAMNIACFNPGVDADILAEILRGGIEKIHEAGAVLVGGHTVTDKEIKYGVSVTGHVHPERIVTNTGAREGDVLILTKAIGTGILTTAFKNDLITEAGLKEAVISMTTLNEGACEAMQSIGVHAATDVTGFGLMGHLFEMASASGVQCSINSSAIPVMEGVNELIQKDAAPQGAYANKKHFGPWVDFESGVSDLYKTSLFDPQTSGGLLISVGEEKADLMMKRLKEHDILQARIIGKVLKAGARKNVITVL